MSAWIVSKEHINYMINAGLQQNDSSFPFAYYHNGNRTTLTSINANHIGQQLWEENHKSVNYRYDGDVSTPEYKYTPLLKNVSIPTALKQISCYEYQSCEHGKWKDSESKVFCDSLKQHLITLLDGYDEAPWGIESP